ncbi:MAG TPA: DUF2231 domain-containing protein [Vicinamibacterales bacterium]
MKSTARITGHPIHPMLIPYPFALLTSATAFAIGARQSGRYELATTARHLSAAGLASALVAAAPGIVDYFGTVPKAGPSARQTARRHALINLSALACYATAYLTGHDRGRPSAANIALQIVGTGLLGVGGWLGGHLVYHHEIGVEPRVEVQPSLWGEDEERPRVRASGV